MPTFEQQRNSLTEEYETTIRLITNEIIQNLFDTELVYIDSDSVTQRYNQLIEETNKIIERIIKSSARDVIILDEKNLAQLQGFIELKLTLNRETVTRSAQRVKQLGTAQIPIGRQALDEAREIGQRNLAKSLLTNDGKLSNTTILRELRQSPLFNKSLNRFQIQVFPYTENRFINYKPETYADLLSNTTRTEALNTAEEVNAKNIGANFVAFNRTGKDYLGMSPPDPCHAIDGRVFSVNEDGGFLNGVRIPYWKSAIRRNYSNPHPRCRHRLYALSNVVAMRMVKDNKVGLTYTQFSDIVAQRQQGGNRNG